MSSIEENNKMRVRQGEKPSSEMTMREKIATEILSGVVSANVPGVDIVDYAITLTDSLISGLNR